MPKGQKEPLGLYNGGVSAGRNLSFGIVDFVDLDIL